MPSDPHFAGVTVEQAAVSRRRARFALISVGAVLLAAVIAYVAWGWRSASIVSDVSITAGPDPSCPIGTGRWEQSEDHGQVFTILATRGTHCEIPIEVRNSSSSTIKLDELYIDFVLTPSLAGGPLVITGDGSGESNRAVAAEGLDEHGSIRSGRQVAANSTFRMSLIVGSNPRGVDSGGIMTYYDLASARVVAAGRFHTVPISLIIAARTD